MSLLPQVMPQLPGCEFGARLAPARVVGGDLFDFIPLGPGKAAVVIGDVTDKGIPAAIFMAQAHALLHAEAGLEISPQEVLRSTNHHLLNMNSRRLFVTVVYGVLDAATGQFSYARAGHEEPLLCDAQGELINITQKPATPLSYAI
jgi:serine phosphatase RsbU (regulator of sigma subunit)